MTDSASYVVISLFRFLCFHGSVLVGCVFLGIDNIFSLGYLIFWHAIVNSTGTDGACSVVSDSLPPHGL